MLRFSKLPPPPPNPLNELHWSCSRWRRLRTQSVKDYRVVRWWCYRRSSSSSLSLWGSSCRHRPSDRPPLATVHPAAQSASTCVPPSLLSVAAAAELDRARLAVPIRTARRTVQPARQSRQDVCAYVPSSSRPSSTLPFLVTRHAGRRFSAFSW